VLCAVFCTGLFCFGCLLGAFGVGGRGLAFLCLALVSLGGGRAWGVSAFSGRVCRERAGVFSVWSSCRAGCLTLFAGWVFCFLVVVVACLLGLSGCWSRGRVSVVSFVPAFFRAWGF